MNDTPHYYRLKADHSVEPVDFEEFMLLPSQLGTPVGQTVVGEAHISTVFLGMDHNFLGPTPKIFETMILGGRYDEWQWRYATWDEAVAGHEYAVRLVKGEV